MTKRYGEEYEPGQKRLHEESIGTKNNQRRSIRLAELVHVDYEEMKCDLRFLAGDQPPALNVPLSSAYWSKRGFLGAMPEEGALAVVGFASIQKGQSVQPYILNFVPNGYKTALRFHPFGGTGDRDAEEVELPEGEAFKNLDGFFGPTRHKMRKIYPGEVYGMSEQGSELVLDEGARLTNQHGSKFHLRSDDKASLLLTLDDYRATAASRSRSGRIIRNKLNVPSDLIKEGDHLSDDHPLFEDLVEAGLIFDDGSLIPDVNSLPSSRLDSGERHSVITRNGRDPNDPSTEAYVENRTEVQEFSNQQMPHPPETGFDADRIGPEDHFQPFIESVTGTVVGNDPYTAEGRRRYGEVLRPAVFSDPRDTSGTPRLETLGNSPEETGSQKAAAGLYRMRRPDDQGQLFAAHDKEGHVYLSVPASSGGTSNLGAGRSVEADLKGSTKMTMSGDQASNTALDIHSDGGFKWNISGSSSSTGRSFDLHTQGGIYLDAEGTDRDGYALKGRFTGDWEMAADGDMGVSATGDHVTKVGGKKEMSAQSYALSVGTGDMQRDVGGNVTSLIKGGDRSKIGEGQEVEILKPLKRKANAIQTRVKVGNESKKFLAPANKQLKFQSAGRYNVSANGLLRVRFSSNVSGSYTFKAPSGNYMVNLGAGPITLTSGAGPITLTSGTSINMSAPTIGLSGKVGLGGGQGAPLPVIGGKPGPSPHISRITGLPLDGNPLVSTV